MGGLVLRCPHANVGHDLGSLCMINSMQSTIESKKPTSVAQRHDIIEDL